ncbi:putative phage tail protein [Longirhabdus pacifica]|uniref:putative phage tail protein n=1 Tax=Longirhabdus pacifica TaxID=2305227 RepID=UPI001008EB5B|nr:putative phage tail protein [Longirhabdus pacifica]
MSEYIKGSNKQQKDLITYLPPYLHDVIEFNVLFDTEGLEIDQLQQHQEQALQDIFIVTASEGKITRLENFLKFKGEGTLEQRKTYLLSLLRKGQKLNGEAIKNVVHTVTGSKCVVTFFSADELNHPHANEALLQVQVLSPDNNVDYKYDDIQRALQPLVPAHIKLLVIKYFSTWEDIYDSFTDWETVKSITSWDALKNIITI